MKRFTLHIPKDIESQLRRCRASIRQSIRNRLQAIVESLAARSKAKGKANGKPNGKANGKLPAQHGPPTRFYVFEGYRVSYHVDPLTRRVVVLSLQAETS